MHEGHRERLKKRFINEGLDNFEVHNVLELLLFYSIPQKDTNETAHRLLDRFGSLSEVLDAPVSELVKVEGIGEHTAVFLSLMPQLCRRYMQDKTAEAEHRGIPDMAKFAARTLSGLTNEHFMLICVDNTQTMLNYHFISEGTVDSSTVDLRKIIQILIGSNATAAVVAHNHPRGNAMPSRADLKTTMTIASALRPLSIKLLDHVVVKNEKEYTSMAEFPQQFGCYLNPV